jgi:hypothetical protein
MSRRANVNDVIDEFSSSHLCLAKGMKARCCHLAGMITIGAACDVPVSVSENMNIMKLNICFDGMFPSSIQNHPIQDERQIGL